MVYQKAMNKIVQRTVKATIRAVSGGSGALAGSLLKSKYRKSKKNYTFKRKYKKRYSRKSYGQSISMTKRRKTVKQNHSLENKVVSLKVQSKNPTAMKLAMCSLEPQWSRVQGLSQFDTSTGFYTLANRSQTAGLYKILPCHVWDITSTINYNGSSTIFPDAGYGLAVTNSGTSPYNCLTYALNSQDATGSTITGSKWIQENVSGGFDDVPKRKAFHHWTHIKANLYGVRKRATRFVCQLVMVKDTLADFITAADTNASKIKLYDYLARPFVFNNLNMGDQQTINDIKILKTYEVIIAPTTVDTYGGEAAAVPHIQTVNWFINHNRVRRYDWKRDIPPSINQTANFDVETAAGHDTRVDPKYRVYFLIRALSPEARTVGTWDGTATDPISEPSYDIVIRNKFSNPT